MPIRRGKADVLNRDFLESRSRVLDLASSLDRLDRAPREADEAPDPRVDQLRRAIEALLETGPARAENVQRIFSLAYDPEWRDRFALTHAREDR